MNEKGTNFCSFLVGLEPGTPAYEAVPMAHLGGGMDCVIASYAGIAGSSPAEKE